MYVASRSNLSGSIKYISASVRRFIVIIIADLLLLLYYPFTQQNVLVRLILILSH